jgi:hypothetical protein
VVWVLLWVVLVLVAAVVLGLLGWTLWRKARALTTEIAEASTRLAAVSDALTVLADRAERLAADDRQSRPH